MKSESFLKAPWKLTLRRRRTEVSKKLLSLFMKHENSSRFIVSLEDKVIVPCASARSKSVAVSGASLKQNLGRYNIQNREQATWVSFKYKIVSKICQKEQEKTPKIVKKFHLKQKAIHKIPSHLPKAKAKK